MTEKRMLEVYEDVYQRLVKYVGKPEYSDKPSELQVTAALNDIVREYLDREESDRPHDGNGPQ
jgi:hypothetical protein